MPENNVPYPNGKIKISRIITLLMFLFLIVPCNLLRGQEDSLQESQVIDSARFDSAYHNPRKAALLSAVLPGLGQIYNKRIWKVPIIYAGFVTFGYLISRNQKEYKLWKQAYIDYPDYHLDVSFPLTKESINQGREFYKRQMELSIIATGAFYILQILDATVDAYLFDWSVGEDLSLKIEPTLTPVSPYNSFSVENTLGLRACLSF
jgi:hypothetical protein